MAERSGVDTYSINDRPAGPFAFISNISEDENLEKTVAAGGAIAGAIAIGWAGQQMARQLSHAFNSQINPGNALSASDPRERMAAQLLRRGHASVDEILQSSYGTWPPKGLDIVSDNQQRVRFDDIIKRADDLTNTKGPGTLNKLNNFTSRLDIMERAYGDATLVDERVIRMNNMRLQELPGLLGKSALSSTLGHEGVHILQGDTISGPMRGFQVYGHHYLAIVDHNSLLNSTQHIFDEYTNGNYMQKLNGTQLKYFNYVSKGLETQARIHEIMADGYQRWGQLPQNREQFLVAMQNAGANVPDSVMRELDHSPTIRETRQIFSSEIGRPIPPVRHLNFINNGLTETGRTEFWRQGMPSLYADLIEMYGDGPGRARFDLGENVRPSIRTQLDMTGIAADRERYYTAFENTDPNARLMFEPGIQRPAGSTAHSADISTGSVAQTSAYADNFRSLFSRGSFVTSAGIGIAAGIGSHVFTDAEISESGKLAVSIGIPYGHAATELREGNTHAAVQSGIAETMGLAGSVTGSVKGAIIGATIGSAVPVVGTAIGGATGALIGGIGGGVIAGGGTSVILSRSPLIVDTVMKGAEIGSDHASRLNQSVRETARNLMGQANGSDPDASSAEAANDKNLSERFMSYAQDGWNDITGFFNKTADAPASNPQAASAVPEWQDARAALPDDINPDMPPEVQSLIEVKMSAAQFATQYQELNEIGSLETVHSYIAALQEEMHAAAPATPEEDQHVQKNLSVETVLRSPDVPGPT